MANGWQTDSYGNQVWMPIDPGADPGTEWSEAELGEVESFLTQEGAQPQMWEDYGGYFDPYETGEFYEKEKMQRYGAGIDIGQLTSAWDLKAEQLKDIWLINLLTVLKKELSLALKSFGILQKIMAILEITLVLIQH